MKLHDLPKGERAAVVFNAALSQFEAAEEAELDGNKFGAFVYEQYGYNLLLLLAEDEASDSPQL